jgi:glycosyltransferase involved in cell wall biosynthesis
LGRPLVPVLSNLPLSWRAAQALRWHRLVLVNLARLDPPTNGGLSRPSREMSRALLELARDNPRCRVVFAVNAAFVPQFEAWLGCEAAVVPVGDEAAAADHPVLARLAPDLIVHALFGVEPFHRIARFSGVKQVALVSDALALDFPAYFDIPTRVARRVAYGRLREVDHVVTVSAHARARLAHHFGASVRIVAIAHGADAIEGEASALDPELRYLIYPANDWPHKRHDLLMRVFATIAARDSDMHLVLTGGRSNGADFLALAEAHGTPRERVRDLGYVGDAELATLYAQARALVFPSAYEGFGMPILEAMRARCPVVCSAHGSLPEIAGDAAIVVASDDPADWARAILDELPARRDELVARGTARAAPFTWEATRARYREFFRTVAPDVFGG